jgi:hypothetical protein
VTKVFILEDKGAERGLAPFPLFAPPPCGVCTDSWQIFGLAPFSWDPIADQRAHERRYPLRLTFARRGVHSRFVVRTSMVAAWRRLATLTIDGRLLGLLA